MPIAAASFGELEAEALVGRYVGNPQPLFSRLPFDYRLVPPPVRAAGLAILGHLGSGGAAPVFPMWPAEPRLDDLRAELWSAAAARAGVRLAMPTYQDGAGHAILLTHDIDSPADIERIQPIRNLERNFGLRSSVGFIPKVSWPKQDIVEGLVEDGCEVYCHDQRHDGKLPYQPVGAMRTGFEQFFEANSYVRPLLRGFRSGQLLMTADLLAVLAEWFSYDLSLPDTEHGGPYGATAGCASVYPFLVNGLLEIPLTMPQDFFLANVERRDADGVFAVWSEKLDLIRARGGVAVVNTHPIWTNPGRPVVWSAYERLLRTIVDSGAWITTPGELHDWLIARRNGPSGSTRAGGIAEAGALHAERFGMRRPPRA